MGQQQILLVLLVTVIVGIAVLLAIQLYKTEYVAFEENRYSQILLETGELFQAAYEKPEIIGGGNHDWAKVNFNNVPCSFGAGFDTRGGGKICKSEDGTFLIVLINHGDYLAMNGVAHIEGKDVHHLYSREMRVHRDSVVFSTDWISHQ